MLSQYLEKFNKDEYKRLKKVIQPTQIKCTCGCSGQCIKYGTYKRTIIIKGRNMEFLE